MLVTVERQPNSCSHTQIEGTTIYPVNSERLCHVRLMYMYLAYQM